MLILDIARYNVKCLNIFNSSLNIMKPDICLLYKIRELSLNYVSDGIDEVIKRVSCCKSLSKLDMSFNKIEEFSKLYDILLNTKLQILNLSFNNIEYLKYVNEDTWRILSQSILEVLQIYITSLCQITTRNCRFSGEELKRYASERSFHRTNSFVDPSQINCAKLHIITDLWTCEEEFKVVLNLECIESI
ncbi:hypothetical protein GJ496_006363 [Pomphorhynchus laevis]|nr:hypothetical protein GJ496_006363 [Pomphorhynchus laevis]